MLVAIFCLPEYAIEHALEHTQDFILKSEYDIVLRKFGNLQEYEYGVKARLEHGT